MSDGFIKRYTNVKTHSKESHETPKGENEVLKLEPRKAKDSGSHRKLEVRKRQ